MKTSTQMMREWRDKNRERDREYRRKLRAERPDLKSEQNKRWRAKNQEKVQAHRLLNYAVARGEIVRLPCAVCGAEKTQGHHADYSKPLNVEWLCAQHHRDRHTERW